LFTKLQPENFEVIETEEQLDPREGDIEKGTKINLAPQVLKALESVIIVKLNKGVPVQMQVEKDLPTAFVNIKRAQVSQVIVDAIGSNVVLEGNMNRQTNSVRSEDQNDDSGYFFETMEKSVHGECQTYYTVSQTGAYQSAFQQEAQDQPAGQQSQSGSSSGSSEENRPSLKYFDVQRLKQQFDSSSIETSSEVSNSMLKMYALHCFSYHRKINLLIKLTLNLFLFSGATKGTPMAQSFQPILQGTRSDL